MGWSDVGSLAAGGRADLVVVDGDFEPVCVLRSGHWVA
jgi:cytosine/adenosine deaminase-related metal-dependent hydrolase